jgi:hypothetical protein
VLQRHLLLFPFGAYTFAWHNSTVTSPCLSNIDQMSDTFAVDNKHSFTSIELGLLSFRCFSIVSCSNTRNVLQSGYISILRWRRSWYLPCNLGHKLDGRDSIYPLSLFEILDLLLDTLCCLSYDRSIASSIARLHTVRSGASSFIFQHPLFSLRSSGRCLRLLSPLLVISIPFFIFLSITCFRRQFLRTMWQIQPILLPFIVCRISVSYVTPC